MFGWRQAPLPDPAALRCTSTFLRGGETLPEFDRFGLFAWDDALQRVGNAMARVLGTLRVRLA